MKFVMNNGRSKNVLYLSSFGAYFSFRIFFPLSIWLEFLFSSLWFLFSWFKFLCFELEQQWLTATFFYVRAFLLKSFGRGHVTEAAVIVSPEDLRATVHMWRDLFSLWCCASAMQKELSFCALWMNESQLSKNTLRGVNSTVTPAFSICARAILRQLLGRVVSELVS